MCDSGVVSGESAALEEQFREAGKRKVAREFNPAAGQCGPDAVEAFAFRFAPDEKNVRGAAIQDRAQEFDPVRFGPILYFTAAARMDREPLAGQVFAMRE